MILASAKVLWATARVQQGQRVQSLCRATQTEYLVKTWSRTGVIGIKLGLNLLGIQTQKPEDILRHIATSKSSIGLHAELVC